MARRPVFIPDATGPASVRTEYVDFQWHAGLASSQKQKSVASLHEAARKLPGVDRVLEVSSKSVDRLGIALSAFNLTFTTPALDHPLSVECASRAAKFLRMAVRL